jgi:transposase
MAGAFHDAFGLGEDPETIGHVDADGVALAAIKGLAERLDRKDDRIEALEAETDRLRAENERLRERDDALAARLAAVEERVEGGESG